MVLFDPVYLVDFLGGEEPLDLGDRNSGRN